MSQKLLRLTIGLTRTRVTYYYNVQIMIKVSEVAPSYNRFDNNQNMTYHYNMRIMIKITEVAPSYHWFN